MAQVVFNAKQKGEGKNMKKIIAYILIAMMILVVVGCKSTTSDDVKSDVTSNNPFTQLKAEDEYIFVLALQNIEFFNAHKYMWKKIGEDFGVKTTIVGPSDMDVNQTASAIEQAISKNPKGIITWGFDPGMESAVNNAIAAGIPVVPIVGDLAGSDRNTYVGSSQYELGYLGGEALAKEINNKGDIAVLTLPGVQMFDDREQGFRDAIDKINANGGSINIVAVGDTKADIAEALKAGKDIIASQPSLVGFFGTDSTAAFGAVNAVKEAGKTGQIKIVGMDRNSDILQEIKNGNISGTIAQNDAAAVYWAFLALISEKGYSIPLTSNNASANAFAGPSTIYMKPNYVSAEDVDFYLEANELYSK